MPSKADTYFAQYVALGYTTGSMHDKMMAFLRFKTGTGSNNDMMVQKRTGGKPTDPLDPAEVP